MYCVQNRIYCHDCDRYYIDRSYSNHLRSHCHINNVMKKRCCSCNIDITRNKLSCMTELSLKSDANTQTHFPDKQDSSRKQTLNYKNIDPNLLCDKLRENLGKLDRSESDNITTKMIVDELLRNECITQKQYKTICKNKNFKLI